MSFPGKGNLSKLGGMAGAGNKGDFGARGEERDWGGEVFGAGLVVLRGECQGPNSSSLQHMLGMPAKSQPFNTIPINLFTDDQRPE